MWNLVSKEQHDATERRLKEQYEELCTLQKEYRKRLPKILAQLEIQHHMSRLCRRSFYG